MAKEKEQQRLAEEAAKVKNEKNEKEAEAKSDASPKAKKASSSGAREALAQQKAKEAAAALIERKPVDFELDASELKNDLVLDLC